MEKVKVLLTTQASVCEDSVLCPLPLHQPAPLLPLAVPAPSALGPPPHMLPSCLPSAPVPYEACANPPAAGRLPGSEVAGHGAGKRGGPKHWDPDQLQLADPAGCVLGHPAFPAAFSCVPRGWGTTRPGPFRKQVEGSLAFL